MKILSKPLTGDMETGDLVTWKGQVVLEYFVLFAIIAIITIITLTAGKGNKNKIATTIDGYYTQAVNKVAE